MSKYERTVKSSKGESLVVSERTREHLEFEAYSLHPPRVLKAIKQSGCAVIRGAFPKDKLRHLNLSISRAYKCKDRAFQKGMLSQLFVQHWFRYGFLFLNEIDTNPYQPWVMVNTLLSTVIKDVLVAIHGSSFYFILHNTTFRRQPIQNQSQQVPFHQDSSFMDGAEGIINCWLPFVPCGLHAASLELITIPQKQLLTEISLNNWKAGAFDYSNRKLKDQNRQFSQDNCWAPIFELGDCVIFDGFTIHRTFTPPVVNYPRISLEARSFSASKPKSEFFENNELLRVDVSSSGDYQMTYIGQNSKKNYAFSTPTEVNNFYFQKFDRELVNSLNIRVKDAVYELLNTGYSVDSVLIGLCIAYLINFNHIFPEKTFNIEYWFKHVLRFQNELLNVILQFIHSSSTPSNVLFSEEKFNELKENWNKNVNAANETFKKQVKVEDLKQNRYPFDELEVLQKEFLEQDYDMDAINQSILYIWLQLYVFAYSPNPNIYLIMDSKWENIYYHILEHYLIYLKRG